MADASDAGAVAGMTQRPILVTRLAIAAVQAIALYLLIEAATDNQTWPATQPELFKPLVLVAGYVPLIVLCGLGQVAGRALAGWAVAAVVILAGLGWHDAARGAVPAYPTQDMFWPSWHLLLVVPPLLFVLHVLVTDALAARRLVPPYRQHFDSAWKIGLQALLAGGFVAVFWAMLWLGAGLFTLLDVTAVSELLQKQWFYTPATTLAVAIAVHATDVQPALIRGTRTMVVVLFAWLLPLLALILLGFLACLPILSLATLWNTHFAARLLLSAAVLMVALINAAYQDGTTARPAVLRWAAMLGALELLPLVGLAAWALGLRVGQYGWTTERVLAATAILIAACHAVGYAAAVFRRPWLKGLERTNEATAWFAVAAALVLFSPLADPSRLMVTNQLGRLARGEVTPERFDYRALRFDGARWGQAALAALAAAPETASRAKAALALHTRFGDPQQPTSAEGRAARIDVTPAGRTLPPALLADNAPWLSTLPPYSCLSQTNTPNCQARFIRLAPDQDEVVLFIARPSAFILAPGADGAWHVQSELTGKLHCPALTKALTSGDITMAPHGQPDILVGTTRFSITPPRSGDCPKE
ncbi:MAG: DUF4153 domain-containing protein [Alphaproteobacteria bacterium]|nr:DUF4153 domain-containing protein [Alphaproteobacteria bacterium]